MGNCGSSSNKMPEGKLIPDKETALTVQDVPDELTLAKLERNSTSALLHSLFVILKPTVRRIISKQLLDNVGVLRKETPLGPYDNSLPNESLPIKPLDFHFKDVEIVNPKTLSKDMQEMPDFAWPEADRAEELMIKHEKGEEGMLVLDLIDFDAGIEFAEDIELVVPVDLPLGGSVDLEIGAGGKIKEPSVRMMMPKLRIWFQQETKMCYAAIMACPDLSPYIHMNADNGRGDFMNMTFTERGSLDDVVERICAGFGPKEIMENREKKSSLVGTWFGGVLVQAISSFGDIGNGKPLEVDLKDTIDQSIAIALGKPRAAEVIRSDIKALEEELERALAEEKQELDSNSKKEDTTASNITEQSSSDYKNENSDSFASCGLGLCME